MVYICVQPSTFYYAWQVDAMLLSFEKCGINFNNVHIVSVKYPEKGIDTHFKNVENKWTQSGVIFSYYEDTRSTNHYISSIRPHLLEKHWMAFPDLQNQSIFYHDSDIALTRPIDNLNNMLNDNIVYLSNTIDYIGAKYIESKGHGIFEQMCKIVGIDKDLVRSREMDSGGAQYILKPGITSEFWKNVYNDSEQLFHQITLKNISIKTPDYHELQIWCADMWAVLWNLWKEGYETKIPKELNFTWATMPKTMWEINSIYHNAGIIEELYGMPFYKAHYMTKAPITAPVPDKKWASYEYFNLVVESWNKTTDLTKKQIVRKRV
jgi:hypothetical protein